jgi:hypothetical protein
LWRHNGLIAPTHSLSGTHTMDDQLGKFILIGFVLLFGVLGWRAWQVKQASPQWPTVEGEMLQARVFAANQTGDARGEPVHQWQTEVVYEYHVNGQRHVGKRLRALGRHHFDQASAMQEIAPFQVGMKVKVYYDPAEPTSAVLIPG